MKFKEKSLSLEFETAPPVLKAIALDIDNYCKYNFGFDLTVTRILEHVDGESGVHRLHRAIDFRDEHLGKFVLTSAQREELLSYTNAKYQYGNGKSCLIFHEFNNGPLHAHLQIPQKWVDQGKIS